MIKITKLLVVILFLFAGYCAFADDNELANVYYQSGLTSIRENKYAEAVEKFNKALSYRKEFPQALVKLGECYEKLKDTKKAIKNYRACLKCLQGLTERLKEEEELLSQCSRSLDKIDINYKELLKIKNNYISKLFALANECANKKYYRFSCNILEKILKIAPNDKNARELYDKKSKEYAENPTKEKILPPDRDEKDWTLIPEKKMGFGSWKVTGFTPNFISEKDKIRVKSSDGACFLNYLGENFNETYSVSCNIKITQDFLDKGPSYFGIHFSVKGDSPYYTFTCLFVSKKPESLSLVKRTFDKATRIWNAAYVDNIHKKPAPENISDEWNKMKIIIDKKCVQGYFNDEKLLDITIDEVDTLAGQFGIYVQHAEFLIGNIKYKKAERKK